MRRSKTCRSPAASTAMPILGNDVSGGQAVSGTGQHPWAETVVLITASTPGNEGGPIGFRANDGTDYFDLDQAYPISTDNGLLFDVGSTTAQWGLHPLFAIWSEGTAKPPRSPGRSAGPYHTLNADGLCDWRGSEPSTWAMLLGRTRSHGVGGKAGRTGWLWPSTKTTCRRGGGASDATCLTRS